MTKAELIALVKQYLETDETSFVDNIASFIRLCEEDIIRKVQLPQLRQNSVSNFTVGSPYLEAPRDYLSPYSMAAILPSGEYRFLMNKDVNYIREAYPDPSETGIPCYYSHFDDDTFIIAPSADEAYKVELHYFHRPPSLVDLADNEESWLSKHAENAMLFGTILQGYIYLKGDQDVVAQYQQRYDTAISDLVVIAEGRVRKDTYKTPDRRIPT